VIKKNKDEVSIILPVYNSKLFIKRTLKSVKNQSYKNWKLFIIDDYSSDNTSSILKNFKKKNKKKVFLYANKINKGQSFSRNLAILKSRSKYIAFLDSDDFWHKNKLKKQIDFMKKEKIKFSYTNYIVLAKKNKKIILKKKTDYKTFLTNSSITTSSIVLDRSVIKNIKFPNKIRICEDYYFKSKILMKNTAYNINKFLLSYRIRNKSLQSNRLKALMTIFLINKKFNNLNIFQNLNSLFRISLNSIKKFGLFRN